MPSEPLGPRQGDNTRKIPSSRAPRRTRSFEIMSGGRTLEHVPRLCYRPSCCPAISTGSASCRAVHRARVPPPLPAARSWPPLRAAGARIAQRPAARREPRVLRDRRREVRRADGPLHRPQLRVGDCHRAVAALVAAAVARAADGDRGRRPRRPRLLQVRRLHRLQRRRLAGLGGGFRSSPAGGGVADRDLVLHVPRDLVRRRRLPRPRDGAEEPGARRAVPAAVSAADRRADHPLPRDRRPARARAASRWTTSRTACVASSSASARRCSSPTSSRDRADAIFATAADAADHAARVARRWSATRSRSTSTSPATPTWPSGSAGCSASVSRRTSTSRTSSRSVQEFWRRWHISLSTLVSRLSLRPARRQSAGSSAAPTSTS